MWRKCSSCKNPIGFGVKYFVCSVSTCNGQRTGYVFCSVPCFERHLPGARHKDAAAMEEVSPSQGSQPPTREPQRIIARSAAAAPQAHSLSQSQSQAQSRAQAAAPKEVLVIASRLKDYIAAKAEMNTSAGVMDVLSDYLRIVCDRAVENARADGRKTVMERDFQFLKK